MKNRKLPYVAVGTFVLVVLAGLLVAIAVLQGRTGATDRYFARFDQVAGVKLGTQVLYQGYPVGQVERVERSDEGPQFRVELSVRRGWPIDRDAVVRISQGGSFLSAMVLDIRGGGAEARLEPGEEIHSAAQADLIGAIADTASDLRQLMDQSVKPLVESMGEELPTLLANLRSFSEKLEVAGDRVNAILTEENVGRMGQTLRNVETVTGDLAALTADLGETRERMTAALTSLQRLAEDNEGDVRQAVKDLEYTLEVVASRIDALTYNLEATARNMNEFSREVRNNPTLLLRGGTPDDAAGAQP